MTMGRHHPLARLLLVAAFAIMGGGPVAGQDSNPAKTEAELKAVRTQIDKVRVSGAVVSDEPWTLAGGGAKNPLWAQMFADILGHPVRRQLGTELGARGVASLAASGVGVDTACWRVSPDPSLVVMPGDDRPIYRRQAERFDRVLAAMGNVWTELAS